MNEIYLRTMFDALTVITALKKLLKHLTNNNFSV